MPHQTVRPIEEASELSALIRERRRSLGLSQRDLSELSGVDQANLSRIEASASGSTLSTLLRLCEPLGIDLLAGVRG